MSTAFISPKEYYMRLRSRLMEVREVTCPMLTPAEAQAHEDDILELMDAAWGNLTRAEQSELSDLLRAP